MSTLPYPPDQTRTATPPQVLDAGSLVVEDYHVAEIQRLINVVRDDTTRPATSCEAAMMLVGLFDYLLSRTATPAEGGAR